MTSRTSIELNQLNQEFDNSSIEADVGVTINSITNYGRHLTGVNTRRPEPMRKDDNDLTLRLLHSINGNISATMNLDALKEVRAPPHKRKFQNAATGMRDFPGAVTELDEMWRNIFQSGLME